MGTSATSPMRSTRTSALLTNKWLGLVAAIWVQAIAGNNYTFANYSEALKTILNLNQLQLNNLSVAKDVGKAFGLVAGCASDYLPAWLILLIGSLEGVVGYGTQWLVVSQRIRPLSYWQMCVFVCMGGNSTTWMNTAVLVTCMRNFSKNRGPVVGILKGYIGLSTAIFTDICSALFAANPSTLLLMLTVVPAVVCVSAMVLMKPLPGAADKRDESVEREESAGFTIFNTLAIAMAVYLLAFDVTGAHGAALSRIFVGILFVLLAAPLAVPLKIWAQNCFSAGVDSGSRDSNAEDEAKVPLLTNGRDVGRRPRIGEDHTISEALRTPDLWLLFLAFLCGVGTGMAVINNMGQIGLAMGYANVSVFVSLVSICGFFGRIGAGTLSEHFLRKVGVPRPVWMAASQVVMMTGYLVMAAGMKGSLYLGSAVVGVCYGVRLSISVPTASELFGLKYYGIIYNFLILALPIGSFLFSGLLAGILYDIEAAKGRKVTTGWSLTNFRGSVETCMGAHCYRLVFIVMAGVCLLGLGLDLLLTFRTKKLYLSIYQSRKAKNHYASRKKSAITMIN